MGYSPYIQDPYAHIELNEDHQVEPLLSHISLVKLSGFRSTCCLECLAASRNSGHLHCACIVRSTDIPDSFYRGAYIRVALEFPLGVSFSVQYLEWNQMADAITSERPLTAGGSLAEVDADPNGFTYYWDQSAA